VLTGLQAPELLPPVTVPEKATPVAAAMQVYKEPQTEDFFQRHYLLSSAVWSNASNPGTLVVSAKLPEVFAAFEVIQRKAADFHYARMDVDIDVRLVCSRYHYGAVLVSRSHGRAEDDSAYPWTLDWRQRAQMDGVILACGDKQGCTFEMKWTHHNTFCVNSAWGAEIGAVYVHVLNKLASTEPNPPNTVTVQIWGRMKNLRLAGPAPGVGPTLIAGGPHRLRAEKHSKKEGKTTQSEAVAKVKEGVLTRVAEATHQIAPHLSRLPLVGGLASVVGDVAGIAAPIFRSLGWNKPVNVATPMPTYHPYAVEPYTAGSERAVVMAERLDDLTTMSGATAPIGDWAPSVYKYIRRFGYVQQGVWLSTDTLGTALVTIPVSPWYCADTALGNDPQVETTIPTPLAFMCQYFGFCRGSIRYAIFVCGNSFLSGVLRVTYVPDQTFPTVMENFGGDMISQLVTVQGPTWIYFTVPFLHASPWARLKGGPKAGVSLPDRPYGATVSTATYQPSDVARFGSLRITVAEPLVVTNTATDPVIYFTIFQAAGLDFQFKQYCGRDSNITTTFLLPTAPIAKAEKHSSLADLSEKQFPGLQAITATERDDGVVYNDRDLSFVELMHRYCEGEWPNSVGNVELKIDVMPFWHGATWYTYYEDAMSEMCLCFRWWRGSIRYMTPNTMGQGDQIIAKYLPKWEVAMLQEDQYASGLARDHGLPRMTRGYSSFECPWMGITPYRPVWLADPAVGEQWQFRFTSNVACLILKAAGDDFGLSGPLPPPLVRYRTDTLPTLATNPASAGEPALRLPSRENEDFLREQLRNLDNLRSKISSAVSTPSGVTTDRRPN
jgi:hypothetical protein